MKRRVHVREERRQPCSEAAVLKIEQAAHPSTCGNGLEEPGRGLVRVNARRRQQADKTIRLDQVHGPLDEQRVQVDVGTATQTADSAHPMRERIALQFVSAWLYGRISNSYAARGCSFTLVAIAA